MDVHLTTPRLVLRPFADTEDGLGLVVELDSDPEVMRYITGGRPMTRAEIRAGKGFREPGHERITANTMYVNAGSRHVMEKCGLSHSRTCFEDRPYPVEGDEHGDVE
ncbi:GNAT family N-acetyltransferase [Streptomyces roseoverticillatus]|uniref:GNAT family N-acetyltransferase n=1 Tax=Streptomyces roseoverticillatus TaxID=66429 RepID=UPI001F47EE1D|nr:GNAT family N-acetyltransferase [Streptomyces roseoverticillatus]MCF3101125.1 GNAT family N-acetyltransferase [Streptomyces roseoverticillatus]